MTIEHLAVLGQILAAIENDTLALPALPDVALRLQKLIDDPNVAADEIVAALSGDALISAQLIKSANGAAFADKHPVNNVRGALSRLGYRQVRNLVIATTMSKMFRFGNPLLNRHLESVWEHSRRVAAVSYVLGARKPYLSPDQAMLGGLVSRIGTLPLCTFIETRQLSLNEEELQVLLDKYSAMVGGKLLGKWSFPEELINVATPRSETQAAGDNLSRADYADVAAVSDLLLKENAADIAWDSLAAVQRLGLSDEGCIEFMEHNAARIAEVSEMLGLTAAGSSSSPPAAESRSPFSASGTVAPRPAGKLDALLAWLKALLKR